MGAELFDRGGGREPLGGSHRNLSRFLFLGNEVLNDDVQQPIFEARFFGFHIFSQKEVSRKGSSGDVFVEELLR